MIEQLKKSAVQVITGNGGGSGILWDDNGTVVTNAHVLRGRSVRVVDADGNSAPARILRQDRESDLAVLETPLRGRAADIAGAAPLRPGQIVIAIGNPHGRTGAVTMGAIHTTGPLSFGPRRNWIQSDIRLAPGNSGGMLATVDGKVVGVNTMIFHGLGLAIPASEAEALVRGGGDRILLGVQMIPVPEGLVVIGIEPGSLAERVQVFIGDVLRCTAQELRELLAGVKTSGSAEIPVLRGGQKKALRVYRNEEARAA